MKTVTTKLRAARRCLTYANICVRFWFQTRNMFDSHYQMDTNKYWCECILGSGKNQTKPCGQGARLKRCGDKWRCINGHWPCCCNSCLHLADHSEDRSYVTSRAWSLHIYIHKCIQNHAIPCHATPNHTKPHQTTPNHAKPHHTIHMISGSHFSLFFAPPVKSLVFRTSTKIYDGIITGHGTTFYLRHTTIKR